MTLAYHKLFERLSMVVIGYVKKCSKIIVDQQRIITPTYGRNISRDAIWLVTMTNKICGNSMDLGQSSNLIKPIYCLGRKVKKSRWLWWTLFLCLSFDKILIWLRIWIHGNCITERLHQFTLIFGILSGHNILLETAHGPWIISWLIEH